MPLKVTTFELANPLPTMVRVTGLEPDIVTRSIVCALAVAAPQASNMPTMVRDALLSRSDFTERTNEVVWGVRHGQVSC